MHVGLHAKCAIAIAVLLAASASAASAAPSCISHIKDPTTIVLTNNCNDYVSWGMCVRVAGRAFDDYPVGTIAPKGSSRYGMYKDPDIPFSAELSSCKGKGCKVIQPRCTDPKLSPDDSVAASPPVLFCPKDLSKRPGSDARAQEHNKLVEMCKVAFPDDDSGAGTARSTNRQSAKGGVKGGAKQPPSTRTDQSQRSDGGARPAPPVGARQAPQAPAATNRQFLDALSQGLAAAAGAMAKRPVAKVPSAGVPTTSVPQAGAAQFPCRDRRQYDACIPQYISRGLPYGYEGRDIRQVAHEYCQRNFCR